MREAIYESHGIMTSADKNTYLKYTYGGKDQQSNGKNIVSSYNNQHGSNSPPYRRSMHRFGSGEIRHHSVTEKLTFPAEALGMVDTETAD